MPRIACLIEYHGGPFNGWQRQADAPSVQQALEEALGNINGGVLPVTHAAGRTDAGVHAEGQVIHVDLDHPPPDRKLADAINFHLRPAPISVLGARRVSDAFEARFDAVRRHYRYTILNRRAPLALDRGLAWRVPSRLDARAMHDAAQALLGRHDFSTFRDASCQADSPMRTLDEISCVRVDDRIEVRCQARSFLHRQVRSIVGSLVEVGRGRQTVDWIADILASRHRARCGPVAPADGLCLTRVDYPVDPFGDAR